MVRSLGYEAYYGKGLGMIAKSDCFGICSDHCFKQAILPFPFARSDCSLLLPQRIHGGGFSKDDGLGERSIQPRSKKKTNLFFKFFARYFR